jgi:hypothetical protein
MPNQPLAVVLVENVAPTLATGGAAPHQHLPANSRCLIATGRRHFDDVSEAVVRARIGGVDCPGLR